MYFGGLEGGDTCRNLDGVYFDHYTGQKPSGVKMRILVEIEEMVLSVWCF